jgi:hypothetical protein
MRFLKQFNSHRIMNEAGEADAGAGADASSEGGFGESQDNSSDLWSDSPSDEDIFKSHGLDLKKYETQAVDSKSQEATGQEDSQGSDEEEQGAGQETDEKSLLDLANSLGAIHGETPIKIESKDQLKNLIQMGHDYTQKTQALSSERKVFDSEKAEAERIYSEQVEAFNQQVSKFDSQLRELQQWQYTLDGLKSASPDLFDEIQRAFAETGKQFENPVINQKIAALEAEVREAKKGLTERENRLILEEFDKQKSSLSSLEQSWKELGVTVDWDQAKKTWAATGLKELEQVVRAMYGGAVDKARESKAKVATVQKKVATAKTIGVGGAARPGKQVKAIDPKLSSLQYANALWDRYANN